MVTNENNDKVETGVKVDIEKQLLEIINTNNSIWIIAIKSFELGKKH